MKLAKATTSSKGVKQKSPEDLFFGLAKHLVHPDIELCPDFSFNLLRTDARKDEDQRETIELSKFWLPPNGVYDEPQLLINRHEYVGSVVLAAEKQLRRSKRSKTRNARVVSLTATLSKFFEYIWLKNKFDLASVLPEDFSDLARSLAHGGWHEALSVEMRLMNALSVRGHELASQLVSSSLNGILENALGPTIGTNIAAREAAIYRKPILKHHEGRLNPSARKILASNDVPKQGMKRSMLRQTLQVINLLIDLPAPYGLKFLPFVNPSKLSKKLTKPPGATRNLGAIEAGALLSEGYRWLYRYGEDIAILIDELCAEVRRAAEAGRKVLGESLEQWLATSKTRERLEEKIGITIDNLDVSRPGSYSVRELLLTLMTGCMILVATMNGRRRDEVSHRKFGLHFGFTSVVDEELEIYKGLFYIEKTIQDHDTFYVNKTTREVAVLLESIQRAFDDLNSYLGRPSLADMPDKERSLFAYHRFSRVEGMNETRNWFVFESARESHSSIFLRFALGEDYVLGPQSHMFRRVYALVLMYQHEVPSMQAISYQLRQDSLGTTQIYLNDPIMRSDNEQIRNKLDVNGGARAKRFASHVRGLEKEVALVSDEMMIQKMLEIISDAPTSGGYPNFIKRFYRMISSRADFSKLTLEAKAEKLAFVMKQRGHAPAPKREGICMVGNQTRVPGARCRSKEGVPQKELASASKCSKCAYHFHSEAYIKNLEEDLAELNAAAKSPHLVGLERRQLDISIADLNVTIHFHQTRFAACGVPA